MDPFKVYRTVICKFVAYPLKFVFFDFTDPFFKITIPCYLVIVLCVSFLVFTISTCITQNVELCMQSTLLSCFDAQVIIIILNVNFPNCLLFQLSAFSKYIWPLLMDQPYVGI